MTSHRHTANFFLLQKIPVIRHSSATSNCVCFVSDWCQLNEAELILELGRLGKTVLLMLLLFLVSSQVMILQFNA